MVEMIVKKGSSEFKDAQKKFIELFFDSKEEDYIKKGQFESGENKGKFLGMTSKKIQEANLPLPFGCPDLFIQPCFNNAPNRQPDDLNKLTGVIWFCNRTGCICVCCREDFTGEKEKFPDYCPEPWEMQGAEFGDEREWENPDDEWEDYEDEEEYGW